MNIHNLAVSLQAVLDARSNSIPGYQEMSLQQDISGALNYLDQHPHSDTGDPQFAMAVRALRHQMESESELKLDGRLLVYPGGAIHLHSRRAVSALVWRASRLGAIETARRLDADINADTVGVTINQAVGGIQLARRGCLDRGVELVPWDVVIADDEGAAWISYRDLGQPNEATAVLRQRAIVGKRYGGFSPHTIIPQPEYADIDNAFHCVCIAGAVPIYPVGKWVTVDACAPGMNTGRQWASSVSAKPSNIILDAGHMSEAAILHSEFTSLPLSHQDEIRVPLDRLNRALRQSTAVDSAIDLGIAMEALFIPEPFQGTRKSRISNRATQRLGRDKAEVDSLWELFTKLYDDRGKAVHYGRFDSQEADREVRDRLVAGYAEVARALRQSIHERIDWRQVTSDRKKRRKDAGMK